MVDEEGKPFPIESGVVSKSTRSLSPTSSAQTEIRPRYGLEFSVGNILFMVGCLTVCTLQSSQTRNFSKGKLVAAETLSEFDFEYVYSSERTESHPMHSNDKLYRRPYSRIARSRTTNNVHDSGVLLWLRGRIPILRTYHTRCAPFRQLKAESLP